MLVAVPLPSRPDPEVDPNVFRFCERAAWLQDFLRILVPIPSDEIPDEYAQTVHFLSDLLADLAPTDTVDEVLFGGTLAQDAALTLICEDDSEGLRLRQQVQFRATIGRHTVSVKMDVDFFNGRLCEESRAYLTAVASDSTLVDPSQIVRVVPRNEAIQRVFRAASAPEIAVAVPQIATTSEPTSGS